MIVTYFLIIVACTMLYTMKARPVYKATLKILIEKETPKVVEFEDIAEYRTYDSDYYVTQYKILQSDLIAERVIEKLDLRRSPEFPASTDAGGLGWLRQMRDGILHMADAGGASSGHDSSADDFTDRFLARVTVEPMRGSRIVAVSFKGFNPQTVAAVADAIGDAYVDYTFEKRFRASQRALEWFDEHVAEVKEQMEAAERAVEEYRAGEGLVSLEEKENITAQRLAELSTELTKAKTDRIGHETLHRELLGAIENGHIASSLPPVINNPLIQSLKEEYARLSGEYSELSKRYKEKHPKMIRMKSQLESLDLEIEEEVKNILASIETDYRVAKAREKTLEQSLEQQKKEALELGAKAVEYKALKQEAGTSRQMYEALLMRMKETGLTGSLEHTNVEILDRAKVPAEPSKPNKKLNLVLSIVLGLMAGVGMAFAAESMDKTVRTTEDAERLFKLPSLGYINYFPVPDGKGSEGNGKLMVVEKGAEPKALDRFSAVGINILYWISTGTKKSVLVTSAVPAEGKTTVVANLAATIAQLNKRVLLVDADLRNPRLHELFCVKKSPGLTDMLAGYKEVRDVIVDANLDGLKIVASGSTPSTPSNFLASERMRSFVSAVRDEFDIVLYDTPPVLAVADALLLSRLMDGVVVVIESGKAPSETIQSALNQLMNLNLEVGGTILNKVDISRDGYYYHRYYHKYYGDYYEKK